MATQTMGKRWLELTSAADVRGSRQRERERERETTEEGSCTVGGLCSLLHRTDE